MYGSGRERGVKPAIHAKLRYSVTLGGLRIDRRLHEKGAAAVRAVSDYGGQPAGAVDRTEHPLGPREKRIDAMKSLVQKRDPLITSDVSRRAQEELDQATYDSLAYYDRWLVSFKSNLVERGYLSDAEIDERIAAIHSRPEP